LSTNSSAIELLREHPKRIDWKNLSVNSCAIFLLKEHPDKINWLKLLVNENAYEILNDNMEKHNRKHYWHFLSHKDPYIIRLGIQLLQKRIT
jgi:hypothetical protein